MTRRRLGFGCRVLWLLLLAVPALVGCREAVVKEVVAVSWAGDKLVAGCQTREGESVILILDGSKGGAGGTQWLSLPTGRQRLPIGLVAGSPDAQRVAVRLRLPDGWVQAWSDVNQGKWHETQQRGPRRPQRKRGNWLGALRRLGVPGFGKGSGSRSIPALVWPPLGRVFGGMEIAQDAGGAVWDKQPGRRTGRRVRLIEQGERTLEALAWTLDGGGLVHVDIEGDSGLSCGIGRSGIGPRPSDLWLLERPPGDTRVLWAVERAAEVRKGSKALRILEPGKRPRKVSVGRGLSGVYAWDEAGRRVAVVAGRNRIYVIDAEKGTSRLVFDGGTVARKTR